MGIRVRKYQGREGVWEVDIRIHLPDGSQVRERKKAPVSGRSAALRWAEARERELFNNGRPRPKEKLVPKVLLREFAPRVLADAEANRQKPSSVAAKESVMRLHLLPMFGDKSLDAITTLDVQRLKASLPHRSPKTVNNVLTVLSAALKKAVEWGVVERMPCVIKLLPVPKGTAKFHDFGSYGHLVQVAERHGSLTHLAVLLGGEAGLRCGEMMALEWSDLDLAGRQMCVARSEWKGRVTVPKGGRVRYVPLTERLAKALSAARHVRSARVLCDEKGAPLTQRAVQGLLLRAAREAGVRPGVHILRHTFCSHLAMRGAPARAIQELAGHQELGTTQRYMHLSVAARENAIRLLETDTRPKPVGEMLEVAGIETKNPANGGEIGCGGGI